MKTHVVFRARPEDNKSVQDLLSYADRLVLHADRPDTGSMLCHGGLFIVRSGLQVKCVCGLALNAGGVAQIKVMALFDEWPADAALRVLLPAIQESLQVNGTRTLAYVGMEDWLLQGLLDNGFRQVNTVITLQKSDFDVPGPGNPDAAIRPARQDDLEAVLAIDRAVFEPLWRNDSASLADYMDSAGNELWVAELQQAIAGYQCLSLIGRHGHITRVAVHPHYQGQQIGVRLLAKAVSFFQHEQVFGMTLNTQEDNHRARRLYSWFGFQVLGREARVLVWDLD